MEPEDVTDITQNRHNEPDKLMGENNLALKPDYRPHNPRLRLDR